MSFFNRLTAPAASNVCVARYGTDDISENEFRLRTHNWRATFRQLPAQAIALHNPDGVEFAAALVGAWYAGKTVYIPGDVQADTCQALLAENVAFVGTFPPGVPVVSCVESAKAAASFEPLDGDTVHIVIFTSGSTGAPQAVSKRLSQLLAEVKTLELQFGAAIGNSDVIATVSHQHIYGLLFKILWPLASGRPFVSTSVTYPEQLLALLATRRAAMVSGPAHLKRLPATLNWSSVRENVCAVFSSGGPLPDAAAALVERLLGVAPVEVFGSSETGGIAWRQRALGAEKPWTPLSGVTVALREGNAEVRSPHLPNDEWFALADNIAINSDSTFTLLGRTDRVVKVEGKRVSLVAMENALQHSGLVAESRVVQLPGTRDELGAAVVLNDAAWTVLRSAGMHELRARLDAALSNAVERIAMPRKWRWLNRLPVNASGKTAMADVVDLFAPGACRIPALHVVEHSPAHALLELHVSAHLACFDGHFHELPVLAGVVQTDWAILFGREQFGITTSFERMEALKFQRVYQPGALLTLRLDWNADRRRLSFQFESQGVVHSSGRTFFAA